MSLNNLNSNLISNLIFSFRFLSSGNRFICVFNLSFRISQHSPSDKLGKKSLVHTLAGFYETNCLQLGAEVCVRGRDSVIIHMSPLHKQYKSPLTLLILVLIGCVLDMKRGILKASLLWLLFVLIKK